MQDTSSNWLSRIRRRLDSRLRRIDLAWNRTYLPEDAKHEGLPHRFFGHAPMSMSLLLLLLVFVVLGPTMEFRGTWASLLILGSWVVLLVTAALVRRDDKVLWIGLGILFAVAGVTWFLLAGEDTVERSNGVYRHILIPLLVPLAVTLVAAKVISHLLFKDFYGAFAKWLPEAELFAERPKLHISKFRMLRSLLAAPILHPVLLLFPPSVAALIFADRTQMWIAVAVVAAATWAFIALSDISRRVADIANILRQTFLVGGQLVVSIVVIGIALARLRDVQYVSTLIETSPTWGNLTVLAAIAAAYFYFWFYGYWTSRILSEGIVDVFSEDRNRPERGRIPYPFRGDAVNPETKVLHAGRDLQVHGASRFVVVGTYEKDGRSGPAWHFHTIGSLIDNVVSALRKHNSKTIDDASVIKERARFYNVCLNFIFLLLVAVPALALLRLPQAAIVTAEQARTTSPAAAGEDSRNQADSTAGRLPDISDLVFKDASAGECGPRAGEPRILLAASGGGTRAAIYAASVLKGVAEAGLICNLVLASGVSGGSAALAYFAGHQGKLRTAAYNGADWQNFGAAVARPFIQDALEGIFEWRIAAGIERQAGSSVHRLGVRAGELLAESFEGHFDLGKDAPNNQMGSQSAFGLILNTALVGAFPEEPCDDGACAFGKEIEDTCFLGSKAPLPLRETMALCKAYRMSKKGGGRLIFTNFAARNAFPNPGNGPKDAADEVLSYVVVRDTRVPLTRAAALSANFPPVFSNVPVDVADGGKDKRYWVTDGGAMDNRGVISLLYALKAAVRYGTKAAEGARQPAIHILVAEASATDLGYTQDRGISAKFGAPEKLASQLIADLLNEVRGLYGGDIVVHYLSMPLTLRSNGGLGTHWMLPGAVRFRRPLSVEPHSDIEPDRSVDLLMRPERSLLESAGVATNVVLDGELVRLEIVERLHQVSTRGAAATIDPDQQLVWRWICEDRYRNHMRTWRQALASLTGNDDQETFVEARCDAIGTMKAQAVEVADRAD